MSKKKILLLSDDMRMSSGIATMSKALVMGTLNEYDWFQVGAAITHPEAGKVLDVSEDRGEHSGYFVRNDLKTSIEELEMEMKVKVIGIIYESRPNVTPDVASLCFKSGSPVILKGGSEAYYSNKILSNLVLAFIVSFACLNKSSTYIKPSYAFITLLSPICLASSALARV